MKPPVIKLVAVDRVPDEDPTVDPTFVKHGETLSRLQGGVRTPIYRAGRTITGFAILADNLVAVLSSAELALIDLADLEAGAIATLGCIRADYLAAGGGGRLLFYRSDEKGQVVGVAGGKLHALKTVKNCSPYARAGRLFATGNKRDAFELVGYEAAIDKLVAEAAANPTPRTPTRSFAIALVPAEEPPTTIPEGAQVRMPDAEMLLVAPRGDVVLGLAGDGAPMWFDAEGKLCRNDLALSWALSFDGTRAAGAGKHGVVVLALPSGKITELAWKLADNDGGIMDVAWADGGRIAVKTCTRVVLLDPAGTELATSPIVMGQGMIALHDGKILVACGSKGWSVFGVSGDRLRVLKVLLESGYETATDRAQQRGFIKNAGDAWFELRGELDAWREAFV